MKVYHNNSSTFVPSFPQKKEIIYAPAPTNIAELLPPTLQSSYARAGDNAITHAKATLLVSAAYVAAAAMITLGLLLLAWLFRALGSDWALYAYVGLIVWGICVLGALFGSRKQALWHSPTGISHHEIDSRERLAKHALDTHAKLLLTRWNIDNE